MPKDPKATSAPDVVAAALSLSLAGLLLCCPNSLSILGKHGGAAGLPPEPQLGTGCLGLLWGGPFS